MNKQAALNELKQIEDRAKALWAIIDEPEKPKIRHGDYGIDNRWGEFITEKDTRHCGENTPKHLRLNYSDNCFNECEDQDITILGNIFDDLKLYVADCERAQPSGIDLNYYNGTFRIGCYGIVDLDKSISFFKKGLQIAYTAKRKASK